MKRFAFAAALAAVLAGIPAEIRAQTVTWNYTFVTVDAVSARGNYLYVTGILESEAAPVERYVTFPTTTSPYDMQASCQRMALLAMERPGQYKLQLALNASYPACRLVRVNP